MRGAEMPGAKLPFSILKRIVMGETLHLVARATGGVSFQYPQADRDG